MKKVKEASARLVARRSTLVAAAGLVIAVALILLGLTQALPASASSDHLFAARATYPNIVGSRLDSCNLCHSPYLPLLNYYGLTLWAHDHDFQSIETYDSDGDGWSNIDEILSLRNPGDPFDHPSDPTSVPTGTPLPTDTPAPTATSAPTDTLVPTDTVVPTNTTIPTDPPQPTDTPLPTDTPVPTNTTIPTDPPQPTDTPVPTNTAEPPHSPLPTPTSQPTPTQVPTPTTGPVPPAFVDVSGPPSVTEGDEFEVSVVVRNVTGLYGGQFRLTFDPVYLQAIDGSLSPGNALSPSVVGLASIDNTTGQAWLAVSRQGDQDELSGDVVLATLRFRAVGAIQSTTIGVDNVLLGNKTAMDIPVGGTDGHILSIEGTSQTASVSGQVMLQGRASDNNDGALVIAEGTGRSTSTDGLGNFLFENLSAGTYDFTADAVGYLPAYCVGKVVAAPQTALAAVELVAGDVNDDRVIDILDAVAVGAAFGNPSVNPAADLNDDGQINVLDLILVSANFGKVPSSWTC
jgi:hypothetical protein